MPSRSSRGLGRGLDSLISSEYLEKPEAPEKKASASAKPKTTAKKPAAAPAPSAENGVVMMRLSKLEPNQEQPRKTIEEDSLKELADSLKRYGVLDPLLVCKKGSRYQIIAGERRFRAARLAGLKEVPVLIKDYSPQEVMEISLIENIQREDLNPIEEAMAYEMLINEYSLRQEDVAERVSKSRAAVANRLRLLKLEEPVREKLIRGEISEGHARALLALSGKDQINAAGKVTALGLSVRQIETMVRNMSRPAKPKVSADEVSSIIYQNMEKRASRSLGAKVSIRENRPGRGSVEIRYYSQDELERLMELFDRLGAISEEEMA